MAKNHILRDYNRATDGVLGDLALHVATLMTGNANFTTPPVTPAALTTAANNFIASVAAAVNGTPANTLDKNTKRTALIALLDQLATYVELQSNNDPAKMLSSGFNLASTARTPAAPGMTSIASVINVASGKLGLDLAVADNAWAYIVQYTAQPGGAKQTATFTNPHEATLTNLTPGTMYAMQVQVMGSGNQVTEWCDTVQHMAI
ncbi:MAG TPA: hypothetical protein VGI63_06965 [Verrucomicrobiae bacterium]|jgi:hypothetical protein